MGRDTLTVEQEARAMWEYDEYIRRLNHWGAETSWEYYRPKLMKIVLDKRAKK